MIRVLPRFAALAAAAAACAALIGGTAQAVEPVGQGGTPGGRAETGECRTSMPPQGNLVESLCVAKVGPFGVPAVLG